MSVKEITFGIIGLSEGNGHPYSWSAICNGYDRAAMAECPFPVIPEYLAAQRFPEAQLPNVKVTHIWTQDEQLSKAVARAAHIEHVTSNLEAMLGKVDAVLLARDDANRHLEFSRVFLEAGVPIYIDKPMGLSVAAVDELYSHAKDPSTLFSCSALRYAAELRLTPEQRAEVGEILYVDATIEGSWSKYAVHIIEPVLYGVLGSFVPPHSVVVETESPIRSVRAVWSSGVESRFMTTGNVVSPIEIRVFGSKGSCRLCFEDTFNAFKGALAHFAAIVRGEESTIPRHEVESVIGIIERGAESNRGI